MAANQNIKRDILAGTSLTVGIYTDRHDRAVRRCRIKNLPVNDSALPTALNDLIASVGTFHPQLTSLPLSRAQVTRHGIDSATGTATAWVDLIYARDRISQSLPNEPAFTVPESRTTIEHTPVYFEVFDEDGNEVPLEDGLPAGMLHIIEGPHYTNQTVGGTPPKPEPYMWPRHVVQFYPYQVRTSSPAADVEEAIGKVNSESFQIGEIEFEPNTLRFDGLDVTWTNRWAPGTPDAQIMALCEYQFTAAHHGWYMQTVKWEQLVGPPAPGQASGQWLPINGVQHPTIDFNSVSW